MRGQGRPASPGPAHSTVRTRLGQPPWRARERLRPELVTAGTPRPALAGNEAGTLCSPCNGRQDLTFSPRFYF